MTATQEIRTFGRYRHVTDIPDLTEIQRQAYEDFLMVDQPQSNRPVRGLEELLREVFPIYSYDKTMCLEYVGYELGRPRSPMPAPTPRSMSAAGAMISRLG